MPRKPRKPETYRPRPFEPLYCIVTAAKQGGDERLAVPYIRELEAFRFVDGYNENSHERVARKVELEPPRMPELLR